MLSSLQGDVIEVAQKSPEELSTLFEQVSGAYVNPPVSRRLTHNLTRTCAIVRPSGMIS